MYNLIENGERTPTIDQAKIILALFNINRHEMGRPDFSLKDLFPS